MAKDFNLGRLRTNLASGRVEGLNPVPLDYSTSALNNLATLPPNSNAGNMWSQKMSIIHPLLPTRRKFSRLGGGVSKAKIVKEMYEALHVLKYLIIWNFQRGGESRGKIPSMEV